MKSNRKVIILVGDGMADYPIRELGDRTPLEAAHTPNMDYLAGKGLFGLVKTVPDGMSPGSDTANLSIFGYDPARHYTGRAPLEALNMGIELAPGDVAFRCNIVTITDGRMKNFTADHIESPFGGEVISEINRELRMKDIELHAGVSYRNILLWRNYPYDEIPETTPPHDIQDRDIRDHLPRGGCAAELMDYMERAGNIIAASSRISSLRDSFRGDPTSLWFWGGGRKPAIRTLGERFGLHGVTISAVDLIHGIGRAAGLKPLRVEGVTGYIDTNYTGKADALIGAMREANFALLHVEAPDESGHEGNLEHKMKAIEDFDALVVGRVLDSMDQFGDCSIMVLPDHPTPLSLRTHSADPVPFAMMKSGAEVPAPTGGGEAVGL